jgi:NADH dehydrogenase
VDARAGRGLCRLVGGAQRAADLAPRRHQFGHQTRALFVAQRRVRATPQSAIYYDVPAVGRDRGPTLELGPGRRPRDHRGHRCKARARDVSARARQRERPRPFGARMSTGGPATHPKRAATDAPATSRRARRDERVGGPPRRPLAAKRTPAAVWHDVRLSCGIATMSKREKRNETMKVLVTGGTGVVGPEVVRRLLRRGHAVRLFSRHATDDRRAFEGEVDAVDGDVTDESAVRGAAEGCDAVLHMAAIVAERPPKLTFEAVNVEGTRRLLAEAERAGVRRFVYVSSLGADRGESGYHRSKRRAEALVRGFRGDWLVCRPGNVFGPGDAQISLLLKMVRTLPAVPLVGSGDDPFQPVWCEDLGEALARAVERDDLSGRELDLAGAERTSMNDVVDRFSKMTNLSPARLPLPAWLESTGAKLAARFGVPLPVGADQITMVTEGNVIAQGRENALIEVLGVRPTPLDESLPKLGDSLPERLPSEGIGPMHHKTYRAKVRGARLDAEQLIALVRDAFGELAPRATVEVGAEPASPSRRLEPGATITMALPLRGHVQVRVEEVAPRAITLATLEGHPLAGAVRFVAEPEPEGAVRFEVRAWHRAATLADLLVMETLGGALQSFTWQSFVEAVVERSGGHAVAGVEVTSERPDEAETKSFERWLEGLIRGRLKAERAA